MNAVFGAGGYQYSATIPSSAVTAGALVRWYVQVRLALPKQVEASLHIDQADLLQVAADCDCPLARFSFPGSGVRVYCCRIVTGLLKNCYNTFTALLQDYSRLLQYDTMLAAVR